MAYDFRSVTTSSGTGTTITATKPAGALSTDLLLLCVEHAGSTSFTSPAGWTLVTSEFGGGGTLRLVSFNPNSAGADTAGPWVFTLGASSPYAAATLAIAADTANGTYRPTVDGYASATGNSAGGTFPAATAIVADTLLLELAGIGYGTTMSSGTGSERADVRSGNGAKGVDYSVWVNTEKVTLAGTTTPTRTVTNDNPYANTGLGPQLISVAISSGPPPVDWTDGFDAGDFTKWASVETAVPSRIALRTDTPPATVTTYARFTANDADIAPLTSTENPRAQLNGPRYIFDGDERWVSFSVKFPTNFPTIPYFPLGWLVFFQWYGPPYTGGGPPIAFGVTGNWIEMDRNANHSFDRPWRTPLIRGEWLDFDMRVSFKKSSAGWIDLWYRGARQLFSGGKQRLAGYTMNSDMTLGVEIKPCVYRLYGSIPGDVSVDMGRIKHHATSPAELTTAPAATVRMRGAGSSLRVHNIT